MNWSELYNSDYKKYYIENLNVSEQQQLQAFYAFRRFKKHEEDLKKDIYDMTRSELDEAFTSFMYRSEASALREVSIINNYILYSMNNGYSKNLSHRYGNKLGHDVVKQYVFKDFNSIYSYKDVINELEYMGNFWLYLGWLILEGIEGKLLSEVKRLKTEDLIEKDDKYYVSIERGIFEIPEALFRGLHRLDEEVLNETSKKKAKLVESEYIFKPNQTKNTGKNSFIKPTVRNDLNKKLKEAFEDDTFTMTTLMRCGMNYYAYKFMEESGQMVLNKDILIRLADKYNFGIVAEGYYYKKIMGMIHPDFIEEQYGSFEIDESVM